MLEVTGLVVHYGAVQVLYEVDLCVGAGEIVALLGTNGAGKSTLLRAVSGILRPTAGSIRVEGEEVARRRADEIVARGVVQMPGGRATFPGLTVEENLRLGGYVIRRDVDRVERELAAMFARFPVLAQRRHQPAGSLSGGQQQVLAMARTLLSRPRLLLVDELSLGLAPKVVEELLDVLGEFHDEGMSMVLVEQNVDLALAVAHRAYFLEKGQVRFEGPAGDLAGRDDLLRSVFLARAGGGR